MADTLNELAQIDPQPIEVMAGGESIAVTPIRVRELSAFGAAVRPLLGSFSENADIAELLARHPDAIIDGVAVGIRKPRKFVEGLGLDELVALAFAVLEANADFFARRITPAIAAGVAKVATRLDGSNSTPATAQPGSEA